MLKSTICLKNWNKTKFCSIIFVNGLKIYLGMYLKFFVWRNVTLSWYPPLFYQKPDELYLLLWPSSAVALLSSFSVPPVFASFVWTHLLVIKVLFKFNYDTTHLGFGSPAQKLKMWKLWRCERGGSNAIILWISVSLSYNLSSHLRRQKRQVRANYDDSA